MGAIASMGKKAKQNTESRADRERASKRTTLTESAASPKTRHSRFSRMPVAASMKKRNGGQATGRSNRRLIVATDRGA